MLWRYIARPLLFTLPAEFVHHLSMGMFNALMFPPISSLLSRCACVLDSRLNVSTMGIDFANPVGLAAGFDKQAKWFNSLSYLGFSHVEIGTITAGAQHGNPQPRLFRLSTDQALINRMGFNNIGAEAAAEALGARRIRPVLGVNIGKTSVTPLENADEDYLTSFRKLFRHAGYFAINVSSPNTAGLRKLQDAKPLLQLVTRLASENQLLAAESKTPPKPILLKIAPDLNHGQLDDIVEIVQETKISGIIATNTTVSRDHLVTSQDTVERIGPGGLSGAPLTNMSREVVRYLFQRLENRVPIIGVGGIMSGDDAWRMLCAGASLVQVYTGFIYNGPFFVRQINRYLLKMMDEHGLNSIEQAIGRDA